jgi:RNA 3'-terminal phosphate cyclase (ATP)
MLEIDGSQGEGGGQILRTSLALSILTGRPVRIEQLRAGRSKPGLLAQHLKSVDAAAAVSRAEVEGAALGSTSLVFRPGQIRSGRYRFDIGTAGSTSLVFQTIFLPLCLAGSASTVIITGGTHAPNAPCFDYLERQWLVWLRSLGCSAQLSLDSAGFFPQGGGRMSATIRPSGSLAPLNLPPRGPLKTIQGLSAVANLDASIAERQKRQALRRLEGRRLAARIKIEQLPSQYKGTLLLLQAEFDPAPAPDLASGAPPGQASSNLAPACCYYGLGALGKPAERVADEAVDALFEFLDTDGQTDQYLADQLLLPLAFASGASEFRTSRVTLHLVTNAAVIQSFLPARVQIMGEIGQPGLVRVEPAGA